MKLCVPVMSNQGLNAEVCEHFGSTPWFALCDTDSGMIEFVQNKDAIHAHGGCQPLNALAGRSIGAMVVTGIGRGAHGKLQSAGVPVLQFSKGKLDDVIREFKANRLKPLPMEECCQGHGHSH